MSTNFAKASLKKNRTPRLFSGTKLLKIESEAFWVLRYWYKPNIKSRRLRFPGDANDKKFTVKPSGDSSISLTWGRPHLWEPRYVSSSTTLSSPTSSQRLARTISQLHLLRLIDFISKSWLQISNITYGNPNRFSLNGKNHQASRTKSPCSTGFGSFGSHVQGLIYCTLNLSFQRCLGRLIPFKLEIYLSNRSYYGDALVIIQYCRVHPVQEGRDLKIHLSREGWGFY